MKKTTLLALAVFAWPALNPAHGASDKPAAPAGVADPGAAVPVVPYRSRLDATAKDVAQDADAWPAANARVGQYTHGHSDILKAEEAPAAPRPPAETSRPAPPAAHPMPMPMHLRRHGSDQPAAPKAHQH